MGPWNAGGREGGRGHGDTWCMQRVGGAKCVGALKRAGSDGDGVWEI